MAYVPTDWKNREVEKPRTFTVVENSDGTITLVPAEGTVTEQGTPIVAVTMNKIEAELVKADSHIASKRMHIIDGALTIVDTRSANPPPSYYQSADQGSQVHHDFKTEAIVDLPNGSTFKYVMIITYARYFDASGGEVIQMAIRDGGVLLTRSGTGATWRPWEPIGGSSAPAITDTGWVDLSQYIQSGWNNTFAFARKVGPMVYMEFELTVNGGGFNSLIFNYLPAQFRPDSFINFIGFVGTGLGLTITIGQNRITGNLLPGTNIPTNGTRISCNASFMAGPPIS